MKKARSISFCALVPALLVMAVNMMEVPLPDWTVRSAGVVMLLALPSAAYCAVRGLWSNRARGHAEYGA